MLGIKCHLFKAVLDPPILMELPTQLYHITIFVFYVPLIVTGQVLFTSLRSTPPPKTGMYDG